MTTSSAQLRYEKLAAAGLFVLVAALGWGPFLISAWEMPYLERAFVPILLALGLLTLALVYDAAETLCARGRGVYFAAIFCSIPAVGLVISDPGMLPVGMLLLLVSATIWFASRSVGEQKRFFLAMLAGLLLIAGFAYFTFAGAFVFVFAIWLAALRSSRRVVVISLLVSSYGIGMLLRHFGGASFPYLFVPATTGDALVIVDLLPWRAYVLVVFLGLLFMPRYEKPWHLGALVTLIGTMSLTIATGTNMNAAAAVVSPVLALLAGDLLLESFATDLPQARRRLLALPFILAALIVAAFSAFSWDGRMGVPVLGLPATMLALALAVALILVAIANLPRWGFALLFAVGMWFGALLWPRADFLPQDFQPDETLRGPSYWPWLLILAVGGVVAAIAHRAFYGRRIPKSLLQSNGFSFGGNDFRSFKNVSDWNGSPTAVADQSDFSFMLFGDVTGAESPVTARRGGYFVFRALTRVMEMYRPHFAISLGDLATSARGLAFRRVRQLLRYVPVPLAAIPGNHDVFRGTEYDLRYFHALLGADNRAFRLGSVQFVLLNNAWGHVEEEQFAWLESTLSASAAPFVFVFCHKPVFELRDHTFYAMERREHADRLHELFRTHEVSAVFSGHIHSLLSETRDGVTYIISGGAGSKLTTVDDMHHYLSVHVSADAVIVRALPLAGAGPAPLLELRFSPRS